METEMKEAEQLIPDNIVPMCYGCKFYVASSCTHPESIKVKWDLLRRFSYHYPSVLMCSLYLNGRCGCYLPHKERGADYQAYTSKVQEVLSNYSSLLKGDK